jgi:diaminohydroxyphosphoribosylaminopyrimidine deaminase / 5-amino-6-(5-phosphoribosylamino)uracil reductase
VDAHDTRFMEHALSLARKATGLASPNPLVGCVIVNNGEIVGQGFHEYDGLKHAEILALKAAGEKARGATLYVTLEPCNHTGRTGPCSEAIVAAGIKRVFAAMQDPNPSVSGSGFEKMRDAGIEVHCGLLEAEARKMNESFVCWILTHKPFVTLKSALTLDGQLSLTPAKPLPNPFVRPAPAKLAKSTREKTSEKTPDTGHGTRNTGHGPHHSAIDTWITSEESRAEVHRMRHASDALITGIGTILADNPLLTDRSGLPRRRRLLRVVLDSRLRLTPEARIVKTADDDLLVVTTTPLTAPRVKNLQEAGVDVFHVRPSQTGIDLRIVLAELGRREILSALLEAGPKLNGSALSAEIVHKLVLFYAPKIAGSAAVPFAAAPNLEHAHIENLSVRQIGPDIAVEGYLQNVYRNH